MLNWSLLNFSRGVLYLFYLIGKYFFNGVYGENCSLFFFHFNIVFLLSLKCFAS